MRKIVYLLILIVSLFVINNLVRSIISLWQKHDLIGEAQKTLQAEKLEHQRLEDQLDRVKRNDFVEEEARNKLFMVKPGEKNVILGDSLSDSDAKALSPRQVLLPVWRQWWNLFF